MTDLMFTLRMCRRRARLSIAGVAGALLVACPAAAPARADDDSRLHTDAAAIAAGLDPRVASTLAAIPDPGRRLLALRSYLRAGDTLSERWSWTAEEIRRYEQSQEFRDAQAELDLVVAEFAATNPGYTLYVNRQVRSLDVQIERWNGNPSVGAAAQELLSDRAAGTCHTAGFERRELAATSARRLDPAGAGDTRRTGVVRAWAIARLRFPGATR